VPPAKRGQKHQRSLLCAKRSRSFPAELCAAVKGVPPVKFCRKHLWSPTCIKCSENLPSELAAALNLVPPSGSSGGLASGPSAIRGVSSTEKGRPIDQSQFAVLRFKRQEPHWLGGASHGLPRCQTVRCCEFAHRYRNRLGPILRSG
jgi:hypothetical protein